jgi:hypothetical protein
MRRVFAALALWFVPLLAQIPIPGVPHLPGIPSQLPIPPLVPASSMGVIVQPSQRLIRVAALDGFAPARYASLADLPRDSDGAYMLVPGDWELIDESFCLRVGAHAGGSDGAYQVGPLTGNRASFVRNVLRRWLAHPEIRQDAVQSLLWAILAHADIIEMTGAPGAAARALLTPGELAQLDGGAFAVVQLSRFGVSLPGPVQQALAAENEVRDLVAHGNSSYQQLAAIAVPPGPPEQRSNLRDRWSYDPRGYFIRYLPVWYPTTVIQIVDPGRYSILRDSRGRVTEIANGVGTRLGISYGRTAQARLYVPPPFYAVDGGNITMSVPLGRLSPEKGVSIHALEQFGAAVHAPATFAFEASAISSTTRSAEALVERSRRSFDKDRALNFLRGVLPYLLCEAAGACNAGQVASLDLVGIGRQWPSFDPIGNLASPDDGDRQPYAQSGNPTPQDRNRDCKTEQKDLDFYKDLQQQYRHPSFESDARQGNWTGPEFERAMEDQAAREKLLHGGSGTGGIGAWTDFDTCTTHIPSPQEWALETHLPPIELQAATNHENSHVPDCQNQHRNHLPDTWQFRQQTEINAYDKTINTIQQWLDQNCR